MVVIYDELRAKVVYLFCLPIPAILVVFLKHEAAYMYMGAKDVT